MNLAEFLDLIGFSRQKINVREKLLSTLGGFLGIFAIFMTSQWLLDPAVSVMIVPSMGASAVLLFAAPHAPFSQPWNVLGGHAISAVIGVACWQWIPDYAVAASASVGLAIGAMYFARCIHPPVGATALAAVIGSEKLHQLGYAYEYAPILLNTITILLVAIAFNGLFKWRRYPVHLHLKRAAPGPVVKGYEPINHEDFVYALSHIDTFVDVTEEDLLKIYKLATRRHVESGARPQGYDHG
ncbi:HPP family protein [Thiogranum longum]|uniref:HPP family protein n=1 Tax=Thiogranum longum TaxID=1537524 RepID=A0A4R1H7A7_9GAMM|nr:HPP family protein [Thiogranum longum]TCK17697.1 HPP family protein [Thiogranum longum]